ncbi:MAG: flagellar protein FliT [Rhodocyclaceae bacterium]|nr:flagellar protein FliT [Rhodocyclaceae bacterium]
MLHMPFQIETYQEMSALSAQMVEAAQAQDWERLIALEKSVAALRDLLMAEDDNAGLSLDERGTKAALIQRILDDDAEVRRHTEPWMEHVRQFLGGAAKRRRVENAYKGVNSLGGSAG